MAGLHDAATLGDLVLGALRRFPHRVAFRQDDRELTYAAVTDLLGRLGSSCSASAVCSQARASACCRPTGPRSTSARPHRSWPAAASPRCTRSARSTTTCYACNEAELRFLLVDPLFAERAGQLLEKSDAVEAVFTFGPSDVGEDIQPARRGRRRGGTRPRAARSRRRRVAPLHRRHDRRARRRRCCPSGPSAQMAHRASDRLGPARRTSATWPARRSPTPPGCSSRRRCWPAARSCSRRASTRRRGCAAVAAERITLEPAGADDDLRRPRPPVARRAPTSPASRR